nr:hypothetical protein MarFTME_422 [Marseillevirus futianmevirus]
MAFLLIEYFASDKNPDFEEQSIEESWRDLE